MTKDRNWSSVSEKDEKDQSSLKIYSKVVFALPCASK